MKKLKRIYVEITNRCNLSCSFCPGTTRPQSDMSRADFDKIIRDAKLLTDEIVLHVMGEPLVHPDLLDFVDHVFENNLTVMITTNGVLLEGSLAEALTLRKIRQINISLHAADELKNKNEYLDRAIEFTKLAQKRNPDGYINLRLWNTKTQSRQENLRIKDKIYLNLDKRFDWPDINRPVLQTEGTCQGLKTHCGILVDGSVVPCCLDREGVTTLGNIHQQSLVEIIESDRAQSMVRGFAQNRLVEPLCQRCGYIERFAARGSTPLGRPQAEEVNNANNS